MKTYFDNLQEIERAEFLKRFGKHVLNRDKLDPFELGTFCSLVGVGSLKCYLGALTDTGLDNLILPHHAAAHESGREPDREVKSGGQGFHIVIENYRKNYIPNQRFPESTKKIASQQYHFFAAEDSLLRADFLFVSNDKELAHKEHYDTSHGENKIYIGNGFHRFVAYGLWISQNGFKPLEVYYVELAR